MAEQDWQLSLDPNDSNSWRKSGGAQGRGVIVGAEYELWGFTPKAQDKKRIIQVFATLTIAFENLQRLWPTHQMAGWTPSDKDPKTGLAPSKDGKDPAGGTWERIINIRELREPLPEIHDFRGPLVVRRGTAQFAEEEQFWQNLKALSDASMANLETGGFSLHVQTPGGPRIGPGNFGLDISWMIGLDCDFMPQDSARQVRPKTKKTSVLAESAEPEQRGPVQVLCAVGLYGKKTPEEVAAIKAEYLAREAANVAPASSTGIAPGSITSSASTSSPASLATPKASGKKMDLSPETIAEFSDALVASLSKDTCTFEIDLDGQRVPLEHTSPLGALMASVVREIKGVSQKTAFSYWMNHVVPETPSDRWEYDPETKLVSLKA